MLKNNVRIFDFQTHIHHIHHSNLQDTCQVMAKDFSAEMVIDITRMLNQHTITRLEIKRFIGDVHPTHASIAMLVQPHK